MNDDDHKPNDRLFMEVELMLALMDATKFAEKCTLLGVVDEYDAFRRRIQEAIKHQAVEVDDT